MNESGTAGDASLFDRKNSRNVSGRSSPTAAVPLALGAPAVNPWFIAIAVMLATFMEVLDTTIVTVALPHMAGNLSATTDEATWVLTSYLVSNAVILPAASWFSKFFGRKRFLLTCIVLFTASSFLCGAAASLGFLIAARVMQGAGGGALQPLSQAILLESFPPHKRGLAMAMFGMGIVVAPVIGPTLGGWITDNYSWRWLFYINIPVGITAVLLIMLFVRDPSHVRNARPGRIDGLGFGLMAIGLATLQIVLDKGQQDNWFSAIWLRWFSVTCVTSLVLFVIWELRSDHPIVDLHVLKNRNFAIGTALITLMGVVIYSPLALLPQFLQVLLGYPALDSGLAQSPRGFGAFLILPWVGILTNRVDPRRLIASGFVLAGAAIFMFGNINLNIGIANIAIPNFLQGVGMSMVFVPLATLTTMTLPDDQIGNATGIFNLMRNIGGSTGISMVTTMTARCAQAHQTILAAHLTPYDVAWRARLHLIEGGLAPRVGSALAQRQAVGALYNQLVQQSTMLAYIDNFRWLAVIAWLCLVGVFFLKKVSLHHPSRVRWLNFHAPDQGGGSHTGDTGGSRRDRAHLDCHRLVSCHPERSEGSLSFPSANLKAKTEILRFAQNDNDLGLGGSV
jgi:DHA2 family multidrug resistance protein